MPQQDINQTFHGQQFRKENELPNDINAVEFRNDTPTNLSMNPKRMWIDQPDEAVYFTVNGVDILEFARKNMTPFINVKDHPYKAKGNGISNDTTSLQAAFNVARDAGSATIFIPDGTYIYNNSMRLYKNTTVFMSPNAVIKRTGTINKCFINGEPGNKTYATGYNGEGNIHIYGGTIDLNQGVGVAASMTVSAFDLGHGENISFNKLTITNGQIGHYFQVSGCKRVTFRDCWFGNVTFTDTSKSDYELIQIEAISDVSFPTFGYGDLTITKDVLIENCVFDGVIRAFGGHGDGKYGTSNIIYCENVTVKDCIVRNSYENAVNIKAIKNLTIDNLVVENAGEYGLCLNSCIESEYSNISLTTSNRSGLFVADCHNSNFYDVTLKETALSTASSYAAIRVGGPSNNNTFNTIRVTSVSPHYTYGYLSSDGCTGNKIINHNITPGLSGTINGSDSTEFANIIIGAGCAILFDGDLALVNDIGTLSDDIRCFKSVIIVGNDNSSATAQIVMMEIPSQSYVIGSTTARFRLIVDISSDKVDFSFPTSKSIRVDTVTGIAHIRKVIGVM